ncbi:flagellar motor protein MotB [Paenibacillus sp. J2TS4]|uniref:flagellar motor protein MotB n=1 Tax=Paenibacillus sp. J2TS4 TaxID=2807194 RepID=UPI001BCAC69E|nr:flagellar motor protein MotB [Paenibacillus sp. J2TS4]
MARRGKKPEVPENHERWLITYADLITLLLIFFVIMYAMSKVDTAKYNELAQTLQLQFSSKGDSVLPQGAGVIGGMDVGKGMDGNSKEFNKFLEEMERQKEQGLRDLVKVVNEYIDENQLQGTVSVGDTPRGVAITLNDLLLFDLGKADLKDPAYPILEKLASLFPTLNTKISIEGHTDDLPLATGAYYKDNWRLSSERSLSVLRYFTNEAELPESMFISTAFADTKPIVPNTSNENRQKNRRVEIIVLR